MSTVFFDAPCSDEVRRQEIFCGSIFVHSPTASAVAFAEFARDLLAEAFHPLDAQTAQFNIPVERFAAILRELKPRFIHHPQSKEYLRGILRDLGCDLTRTYFEVPRLRSMAHGDYLRSGIAYAFHPHRDTWYGAPLCEVNFWMPIYSLRPDNAMAFHTRYWAAAVPNTSSEFDYDHWNKHERPLAAQHIKTDTRKQPRPAEDVDGASEIRLIPQAGGLVIFSAAQLHSTVPNTSGVTRFSIDFRIVHASDIENGEGAPNIDSACIGTTLADFVQADDLSRLSDDVIQRYLRSKGTILHDAPLGMANLVEQS
jgi:hypothetical protein